MSVSAGAETPGAGLMTTLVPTGFDTETDLFCEQNLIPKAVCLTVAQGTTLENCQKFLFAHADGDLDDGMRSLFADPVCLKIGQRVVYDLAVCARRCPDLLPVIFQELEEGRVHDISIREKLLNLTDTGDIQYATLSGGVTMKLEYNLAYFVKQYFGIDLSAMKTDDDAWRTNYTVLMDVPTDQWPEDAKTYALDDSVYAVVIWHIQEERRRVLMEKTGVDPFKTQEFRVAVDFALSLMTAWGQAVDAEEFLKVSEMLLKELAPEKMDLLVATGILRPAEPPREHAKKAQNHVEGCKKTWKENGLTFKCKCPVKMTAAVEESVNKSKLIGYIEEFAKGKGITLKKTAASERFPQGQTSTDAEFFDDYGDMDPVLSQYKHRQSLQKLVTTELPRMCKRDADGKPIPGTPAQVVHACFDVLKRTGRTSSYGSDKYPSFNCQNVHPSARNCFVPRPGYVLFGIDYSQMELGTLAQKCLDLFGKSVLADKINAGVDVHGYLGAQLAFKLHPEFREFCTDQNVSSPEDVFEHFASMKKEPEGSETRDFFEHWRKFAKPTGLGYPGGLGPATFVAYAKATYGVIVDEDTAASLREVWHETYPEMAQYFEWINRSCEDTRNGPKTRMVDGVERPQKVYAYTSPMGMYRAGCDYCAAANGAGLQTPSAEGALLGVFNVVRACYDWTLGSILLGDGHRPYTRPTLFIHDEIVGELYEDGQMHERVQEIQRIMVEAMRTITPDVAARSEAVLMRRWDKAAKPVFDSQGRLTVWEPKKKEAA